METMPVCDCSGNFVVRPQRPGGAQMAEPFRPTDKMEKPMFKILSLIAERSGEERGAVAAEYAVLLTLIAVALVVAVGALEGAISGALSAAAAVITGG